jgi:hypothetical protein
MQSGLSRFSSKAAEAERRATLLLVAESGSALVEHEGKHDADDEHALERVHNDPHPRALKAP